MRKKSGQIPLALDHPAAYTRDDFRVSNCNADAMAWIEKWPDWPAPVLIIHGPEGCGKTHLAHIWRERAGQDAEVVEDAENIFGDAAQEHDLFHRYNLAKESGAHLLITSCLAPHMWKVALPDLKSRLMAAPAVAVGAPDDALMGIVLAKLFSDRQIFVPQDVIAFLLLRMERTFATAREMVDLIDKTALAEKRPVTIPLVRNLLESLHQSESFL